MGQTQKNRTRIIGLRLTPEEYEDVEKRWKASTCRKLSDFVRHIIFEKPVVTTYRNKSLDDFMSEAIRLRKELNSIGNNFNQAVKKLHTMDKTGEIKEWLVGYELEKKVLMNKVEEVRNHIRKMGEKWLQ
jgi:hypothetical protein